MGRPAIDLTGQRFGRLTVLRRGKSDYCSAKWICLCDCGKEKTIASYQLRRGSIRSCGCLRAKTIDLTGRKFGRLVALDYESRNHGKHKRNYWRCQCQCGKHVKTMACNLLNGNTTSCGCIRVLENNASAIHAIYRHYRIAAKNKGILCSLTEQDVVALVSRPCTYCGISPANSVRFKNKTRDPYRYNGIDRLDNSQGYIMSNVTTCCRECNFAKGTRSHDEFFVWLRRVASHTGLDISR